MRKALLAASAILIAGGIAAHAQNTTTTPGTSMSNQCWDVSTNTVKHQAPGSSASGTGSTGSTASTSSTTQGSTTGAASSGGSASTATTRPSGMPNC